MKTLNSGIEVEDQEYYKVLNWKDQNFDQFQKFCDEHALKSLSINNMNLKTYQALVKLINSI